MQNLFLTSEQADETSKQRGKQALISRRPSEAPRVSLIWWRVLSRVGQYTAARAAWLSVTVIFGVFLSVVVVNYGGYIDQIHRARIDEALLGFGMAGRYQGVPPEQIPILEEKMRREMEAAMGLDQPFLLRCFRWTKEALQLNLGEARVMTALRGSSTARSDVRIIILQRLPNTLLLSGTSNFILFFISIYLALALSRKHGNWLDRMIVALSTVSATPNWIFGILLIIFFAAQLGWLPYGGMFDDMPPATSLGYIPIVLKHMILPGLAIALSTLFQSVYAWRTFFLLHSQDDYVEMARAKGLSSEVLERRYILRPTLPYIITSFALMLISFWQGALALEMLFDWPGIGAALVQAVRLNERGIAVGILTLFSYLLALTVFLLDLIYAFVDPRVKVGSNSMALAKPVRKRIFSLWRSSAKVAKANAAPTTAQPSANLRARVNNVNPLEVLQGLKSQLTQTARLLLKYPAVMISLGIIVGMIALSFLTMVLIPYERAVDLWLGKEAFWIDNPKNALPVWVNLFRQEDLPETIILDSRAQPDVKIVRQVSPEMREISIDFAFDFPYAGLPQEITVRLQSQYREKRPLINLVWFTPDRRKIELGNFSMTSDNTFFLSQDTKLKRKLGDNPLAVLFANPSSGIADSVKGSYALHVSGFVFEEEADLEAQVIVYGQVYGLAGTDHVRRDLLLPLLWGMPLALAFGLGGAVATSLAAMLLAAVGSWLGGWVDHLIQRLTEINMVLPALPIAIMVYYIYSKSIWAILGVIVLLNVFNSSIKNYRAAFLQIKEAPYIEAARAYGVPNLRLIFLYLTPRILPVLIPQMVILVPGFIYIEATLSFLGLSDPFFPTWGKVIYDAVTNGAYRGYYYWILEPVALLLLTGLAFALSGFTLERIFNPRLREF